MRDAISVTEGGLVATEVRHVGIPITDLARSESFYVGFLGFSVVGDYPECRGPYYEALTSVSGVRIHIRILSSDWGQRIELLKFYSESPNHARQPAQICDVGRWHLAITVRDVHALYVTGQSLGIEFVSPPLSSPDQKVYVCFCCDPDGNLVELVEPRQTWKTRGVEERDEGVSSMSTVAIVQARMTSHRLPGKSLEKVGGIPVAELVLRRLARCRRLDKIVLATSNSKEDDALFEWVSKAGFQVFRGAESDLLDRFYSAARAHGATHIVRVCADNVFVDPEEISRLVEHGLASGEDFVGFTNSTYPERNNDFGGEFIRFDALEKAYQEAITPHDREHVFPYFYDRPDYFRIGRIEVDGRLHTPIKLDLDYPEDLVRIRMLADALGDPARVSSADIVRMANALLARVDQDYQFNLNPRKVNRIETKHRRIITRIPVPKSLPILEGLKESEGVSESSQLPVVWDRTSNYQVFDCWGNCWIDFSSSIFVANVGHTHPHIVAAVQTYAAKMLHAYSYATAIRAAYLEKLLTFVPSYLTKASLFSSGTEASERAIKIARLYGQTFQPVRKLIIGGEGNFHGKTMGAQLAGGQDGGKKWIGYRDPNMVQMPFPYPWVMERAQCSGRDLFDRHIESLQQAGYDPCHAAAFIVEPVQGWGAIFYPDDYMQAMQRFCRENGVLLLIDEIQAGFGRTGRLFSYQHYGIEPDLVICGKGLSGSLPLSAVLGRGKLIELDPAYTSTHGGHPLACAAGLANIEVLERENLIAEASRKETIVSAEVCRWKERFADRVGRINGRGLLFGVFFKRPGAADDPTGLDRAFVDRIIERALEKGVFSIRTGRGTVKLGPPLSIPDEALMEGLRVYEESIAEIIGEGGG